jgi:hypothetical protein
MLRNLLNDEAGFLVSAELVLVFSLVFCAVAVGVATVRDALVTELHDVSEAIGAVNQSYNVRGITAANTTGHTEHATCSGSGFADENDDCDCAGIEFNVTTSKADPSTLGTAEGSTT